METKISNDTLQKLKVIMVDKLDLNLTSDEIDEDISLMEDGLGLDSISIVNFIVNIETAFSFKFSDEEINLEKFKNLRNLSEMINTKLNN